MGWGWLGMILFGLIPLLVVIVLVAVAIKYLVGGRPRTKPESTTARSHALALLQQRYACAEIGSEEYLHEREHLKRG